MRVVTGVAWDVAVLQMPGMFSKAVISQYAVIIMTAEAQGVYGGTLLGVVRCHILTSEQIGKSGAMRSVRTAAAASAG